jgi:hypothetical protein
MLRHRIEREMEYSTKTSLPLYIFGIILPCRYSTSSPIWYNLLSYIVCQRGRESKKGLYFSHKYPFLVIHAKGGESINPKQKNRTTTTNLKNVVFQIWVKKRFFQLVSHFLYNFKLVYPLQN